MNETDRNRAVRSWSAVFSLIGFLLAAPPALGDDQVPISIAPDQIVLNAQGSFDDVLALIVMSMAPGHRIHSFDISMEFDGIHVAKAFALRYCFVDDIFFASFDREQLQQNQDVIDMANSTVTARVEGTITTVNAEDDSIVMEFYGLDDVEIVLPDPCWGDIDEDGDVDGKDLAEVVAGGHWTLEHVEMMASELGRVDCPLPGRTATER